MTLLLLLILLACTAASASSASHGRLSAPLSRVSASVSVVVSVSLVTTSHDLRLAGWLRIYVPAYLRPDLFLYRLMITPSNLTGLVQLLFRVHCDYGRTCTRALTLGADRWSGRRALSLVLMQSIRCVNGCTLGCAASAAGTPGKTRTSGMARGWAQGLDLHKPISPQICAKTGYGRRQVTRI